MKFVAWVVLAWPLVVALATVLVLGKRMNRKWLFGVTAVACGYLAMVGGAWVITAIIPAVLSQLRMEQAVVLGIATNLVIAVAAILGVARFFVARRA